MLSAAPQVSERSTGQSSKLRNSTRASRLDSTGFRFVFYFESGCKKGGWIWRERPLWVTPPPSTYTCCTTVTFPMMPASQLRRALRVYEDLHPLRWCRHHPGPAQQDGRLCFQGSGRQLWTADWQRRGSCSRHKCKLLLLTRLTQRLQLHHVHKPHPHPLPRSLARVLLLGF